MGETGAGGSPWARVLPRAGVMRRSTFILPLATALAACATVGTGASMVLGGTDWRLASIGGEPAIPTEGPNAARLHFDADSGRVFGGGSCNRISGPYTLSGDSLRMGPMIATRMACADERLNAQETAFLGALDRTQRYTVAGDTLVLMGEGGSPLARLVRTAGE